jgi:hypothetical protein
VAGMPVASSVLALVAAFLFAVSVTLQQAAARAAAVQAGTAAPTPPGQRRGWLPVLGLLTRLVRNPYWLAGWVLNVLGFVAHAAALHLGSITAVQAILVFQLMFALMLAAVLYRRRPLPRDWAGTTAVCLGVGLLVTLRGSIAQAAGHGRCHRTHRVDPGCGAPDRPPRPDKVGAGGRRRGHLLLHDGGLRHRADG